MMQLPFGGVFLEMYREASYDNADMQIDILTKNIDLDEPLDVFVHEKIGGLEHYMKGMADAQEIYARVEIGKSTKHHHKGPFFYAECNIHFGQGQVLFRGQSEREDLRDAITEVKNELQTQIRRYKDKETAKDRQPRN